MTAQMGKQRVTVGRAVTGLVVGLVCLSLGVPSARAQDGELTLALFAPSLRFSDSVARARYVSDLADTLAGETGLEIRGVSVSRASDLDEADIAIVDGAYASGSDREVLLAGRVDGDSSGQLALLVASDGPSRLADLRGGTLILPRSGELLDSLVDNVALRGEVPAPEFFGEIERTANVESALSAVAGGSADATVAFARYGRSAGLRVLEDLGSAPFPVVVVTNDRLPESTRDRLREGLASASASGDLSRFGSVDREALAGFRRLARRAPPEPEPQMAAPRDVEFDVGGLALDPSVGEALPTPPTTGLIVVPPMDP